MARKGTAFFDRRGQFFKTPDEATLSDLASMLGKIGDGESLAPGIAFMLLERREDVEKIFAEHDEMMRNAEQDGVVELITAKRSAVNSSDD